MPTGFTLSQISLVNMYKGDQENTTPAVQDAYLIYSIPTARAIIEGLLISKEEPSVIANITDSTVTCVETYAELFFDVSVFLNRLMLVSYIRSLPSSTAVESFHKQIISWGYYLGSSYIAWKIGAKGSIVEKSPEESVAEVLTDATWRSKEHFLSDITDSPTKEARAWIPQVLKSAEVMKNFGNSESVTDTIRDIAFSLQGKDDTLTINDIEDVKS